MDHLDAHYERLKATGEFIDALEHQTPFGKTIFVLFTVPSLRLHVKSDGIEKHVVHHGSETIRISKA
jgi:hypothetical protein